jgi:hypothetical protein
MLGRFLHSTMQRTGNLAPTIHSPECTRESDTARTSRIAGDFPATGIVERRADVASTLTARNTSLAKGQTLQRLYQ